MRKGKDMPLKILVVDDEEDTLKILDIELRSEGYEVITARNAGEAMEQARKFSPDLIVMDILLPDMNGAEAVKMLKVDPQTKDIPVIFLTAVVTRQEEQQVGLDINVDGRRYSTIAKPFQPKELLGQIQKVYDHEKR